MIAELNLKPFSLNDLTDHLYSCKEELYRHLSIDVGQRKDDNEEPFTIDKSLDQFFIPEVRDVRCEKCNFGAATQTIEVLSRYVRSSIIHFLLMQVVIYIC